MVLNYKAKCGYENGYIHIRVTLWKPIFVIYSHMAIYQPKGVRKWSTFFVCDPTLNYCVLHSYIYHYIVLNESIISLYSSLFRIKETSDHIRIRLSTLISANNRILKYEMDVRMVLSDPHRSVPSPSQNIVFSRWDANKKENHVHMPTIRWAQGYDIFFSATVR